MWPPECASCVVQVDDVQVYAEVMDSVQTLDAGRRSMYDPDELEEEQRERDIRNKARPRPRPSSRRAPRAW